MGTRRIEGKGILICLAPGHKSDECYAQEDEMVVVLEGQGAISTDIERKELKKGQSIFIPGGSQYTLMNDSGKDLVVSRIMKGQGDKAG